MTTSTSSPDRLDSWKEIAEYVGRDVRTAIRWERDRGLPVHRVPGGRRGAVFAYRAEVDEWLRRGEEAPSEHAARGTVPPVGAAAPPPAGAPATSAVWLRVRRAGTVIVALLLAAVLGVAALRAGRPSGASAAMAAKLGYGPREIVARTEDGAVIWRFVPPRPVETNILDGATTPWYAILDLDGDGRPETVASVPLRPSNPIPGQHLAQDELICFSSTGRVLWQTRLEDEFRFRGGTFGPPWTAGRVVAFHTPHGARIAWAQAHHTWWPGPIVLFDAKGARLSTFVHAGSIRALQAIEFHGRGLLLAGGVANAHRAAFLTVLDVERIGGHGPVPPGSPFECLDCEETLPLHYFLLPPSDINRASGLPYNSLLRILTYPESVEVFTVEQNGNSSPLAEMNFRFSTGFELLDARSSDSFAAHEFFERKGQLNHSASRCPWYLYPPPAREWTPGGWRDIRPAPPPAASALPPPALPRPAR